MLLSIPARCQEEMPHSRFEDFEKFRRAVLTEAATIMPDNPPLRDGPDAPRKRPPGPSTSQLGDRPEERPTIFFVNPSA
jgi:hypothetical protein